MSVEDIILAVNKLVSNYCPEISQRAKEEKIKFFSDELKNYNQYQIKTAVEAIIKDENIKRFPTIAQIIAYIPKGFVKKEDLKDCDHCRAGLTPVWVYKEIFNRHYQYSYACPFCEAGKDKLRTFPILPTEYHSIPYETLRETKYAKTQ